MLDKPPLEGRGRGDVTR